MICPKCHAENRAGISFCETCGTPLETEAVREQTESQSLSGSTGSEEASVPEAGGPLGAVSACGHVNRPGVDFCETCGARIAAAAVAAPVPTPSPPPPGPGEEARKGRLARRLGIAAVIVLIGGAVGATVFFSLDRTATAQDLVDDLPEPASLTNCNEVADIAEDFVHATARALVEDPLLASRLDPIGDSYDGRMGSLGCASEQVAESARPSSRPDGGASTTEILEYVLRGGTAEYPTDTPSSISSGGGG